MDSLKQALKGVAQEVSASIPTGATLGLGSGSTVAALLEQLSPILSERQVRVVATSAQIESVATAKGLRLMPFSGSVDMVVDGADQVDADLNLVKGGGGALLKEKVVMGAAKSIAIVAASEKFSDRLCERGVKVPVEVFQLARQSAKVALSALGGAPEERVLPKGYPYFTEGGNVILDTAFRPIEKPREMEVRVKSLPGVAEVGIFTFKPITVYRLKVDGGYETLRRPASK